MYEYMMFESLRAKETSIIYFWLYLFKSVVKIDLDSFQKQKL